MSADRWVELRGLLDGDFPPPWEFDADAGLIRADDGTILCEGMDFSVTGRLAVGAVNAAPALLAEMDALREERLALVHRSEGGCGAPKGSPAACVIREITCPGCLQLGWLDTKRDESQLCRERAAALDRAASLEWELRDLLDAVGEFDANGDRSPISQERATALTTASEHAHAALAERPQPSGGADLDAFQREVSDWARTTFPREDENNVLDHFKEEADELHCTETPEERRLEAADVLLLLMQVATHSGFSLRDAARAKFERIRHQRWEWREDLGYYKRVKDADESAPAAPDAALAGGAS